MIALWMLYGVVLAALLGAAAYCADTVFRAVRGATRVAWATAMIASVALPVIGFVVASQPQPAASAAPDVAARSGNDAALAALLARARDGAQRAAPETDWRAFDRPLLALWLVGSLAALGWLGLSRRRLRQALRTWHPAVVRDEPVLVTPDVGPAVVGEAGGRIVLPTWALSLDERQLALMLAHERAHLAARDPQLLAAAAVVAAVMPWNPALWWQLRRLRLAVEIDCDRRVLRRYPDVPAYGALLLDVARRDVPRHLAAVALSSATTSLERRIRTMTMRRPRHPALKATLVGAAGVALVIAACEAPRPTGLKPQSKVALTSITNAVPDMRGAGVTIEQARLAIAQYLPALAKGTGTPQMAWFVLDATGKIVKATSGPVPTPRVARSEALSAVRSDADGSSRPDWMANLDPNAIESINVLKVGAGQVAPDSVGVLWIRLKPSSAPPRTAAAPAETPTGERAVVGHAPTFGRVAVRTTRADSTGSYTTVVGAVGTLQPLFIVDGVVVPAGPDGQPALPEPSTISSVNVLKGAAASAAYGDSAAIRGVVDITTKAKAAAAKPR